MQKGKLQFLGWLDVIYNISSHITMLIVRCVPTDVKKGKFVSSWTKTVRKRVRGTQKGKRLK